MKITKLLVIMSYLVFSIFSACATEEGGEVETVRIGRAKEIYKHGCFSLIEKGKHVDHFLLSDPTDGVSDSRSLYYVHDDSEGAILKFFRIHNFKNESIRMNEIKELSISIKTFIQLNPTIKFNCFDDFFKKIKNLDSLKIDFESEWCLSKRNYSDSYIDLFYMITGQKKLKNFSIMHPYFKDEKSYSRLKSFLEQNQHLESIQVQILNRPEGYEKPNDGIDRVALILKNLQQGLANNTTLKSLKINFEDDRLKGEPIRSTFSGRKELASILKNHPTLEELSLLNADLDKKFEESIFTEILSSSLTSYPKKVNIVNFNLSKGEMEEILEFRKKNPNVSINLGSNFSKL